jgi:hypothetical protein
MAKLESDLGLKKGGFYTQPVEGMGDLNDKRDILGSKRTTRDMLSKSNLVTDYMVGREAKRLQREKDIENTRIRNYDVLDKAAYKSMEVKELAENTAFNTGELVNINKRIETLLNNVNAGTSWIGAGVDAVKRRIKKEE